MADTGFCLCGIADEPPRPGAGASRTSPISVAERNTTSVAILASAPIRIVSQRAERGDRGRGRCGRRARRADRESSRTPPPSRRPFAEPRDACRPARQALRRRALAHGSRNRRRRPRSPSSQFATAAPNVIGAACWPRLRPICGVLRCRRARRDQPGEDRVEVGGDEVERRRDLQRQGGVENVLAGRAA